MGFDNKQVMIEVKDLVKSFQLVKKEPGLSGALKSLVSRKFETIEAVKGINMTIHQGEIIGYIGANGAGKSTTIKMMTGILTPTQGSILVDGLVPYKSRQENAKRIGVVFGQKTQLWWDLPLSETFSILKEIYEVPEAFYKEQMIYFNDVFGLDEFIGQTVRTLSLGQRMRADLAAAMLHNPKVLYLDEPTIGLDVMVKERMRKAIKELNARYGTTIILTTHDMSDIEELCHRIVVIDQGELLYDGDIERIRTDYGNERKLVFDLRFEEADTSAVKIALDELVVNLVDQQVDGVRWELLGSQMTLHFKRGSQKISAIMGEVLKAFNVLDFSLQDMDIEAIVKNLMASRVKV